MITGQAWLVRVPRIDDDGKPRDAVRALRTFEHEPWSKEARFLGMSTAFVLFERPDPSVAAEARAHNANPIAWLELHGTRVS